MPEFSMGAKPFSVSIALLQKIYECTTVCSRLRHIRSLVKKKTCLPPTQPLAQPYDPVHWLHFWRASVPSPFSPSSSTYLLVVTHPTHPLPVGMERPHVPAHAALRPSRAPRYRWPIAHCPRRRLFQAIRKPPIVDETLKRPCNKSEQKGTGMACVVHACHCHCHADMLYVSGQAPLCERRRKP